MKNWKDVETLYSVVKCSDREGSASHIYKYGNLCFKLHCISRNSNSETNLYIRNSDGAFVLVATNIDFKEIKFVEYHLSKQEKESVFKHNEVIVKCWIRMVYKDMA